MIKGTSVAQILQRELKTRTRRNPSYSLRAFSRDLGLGAPTVSRIMRGDRGLSAKAAEKLAKTLNFSISEAKYFRNIAVAQFARGKASRVDAQASLSVISEQFTKVDEESFSIVSEWYHFAIISLMGTNDAESDPQWIANRLGITEYQAETAIDRLLKYAMLERVNGTLKPTGSFFADSESIPSKAIQQFHHQLLQKATSAIYEQPMEDRILSTLIMPVDESDLENARICIQKFWEDFDLRFSEKAKKKDRVMALGIQFYTISKMNKKEKKQNEI